MDASVFSNFVIDMGVTRVLDHYFLWVAISKWLLVYIDPT